MHPTRTLLAVILMQSAGLCAQSILDLSVPMTTIETEESSSYQAGNAPPVEATRSNASALQQTPGDKMQPQGEADWQDEVLWDDFVDSDL